MGGSDHCYFFGCNSHRICFLTPASKNDGKHIEIRTVHFARPKLSFRFERISKLDGDYSY